jgi:hypothetical protein
MPSNEMTPAQRQLSEGPGIRGDWGSNKRSTALLREEGATGPNDGMDSWWRPCADAPPRLRRVSA